MRYSLLARQWGGRGKIERWYVRISSAKVKSSREKREGRERWRVVRDIGLDLKITKSIRET